MKIKGYFCDNCKSDDMELVGSHKRIGVYCASCLNLITWTTSDDKLIKRAIAFQRREKKNAEKAQM